MTGRPCRFLTCQEVGLAFVGDGKLLFLGSSPPYREGPVSDPRGLSIICEDLLNFSGMGPDAASNGLAAFGNLKKYKETHDKNASASSAGSEKNRRSQKWKANHANKKRPAPRFEPSTASHGELDATQLLTALTALKKGNFSIRLPLDWNGTAGKIADAFNDVIERNEKMAKELARISRVVGKEGQDQPARLDRRG